ncbi:hypothetical protein HYFRA_00005354 [Hymenoscyphus fraxineus]|uniref:Extracellular membrane protein CFEM domain-containing protein n=1 Tax=Hymenoscyphus fraxineus TaxID=746836 RepID=A0A9N9PPS0_9HELO|nr:hypothetical protein HYFRA_00005354 [Hymenoscyphus fraxineus]
MQFSKILSTVACLLATSTAVAIPASIDARQSSTTAIETAPLQLGACLALGKCYTEGNVGCLTAGCGTMELLGSVCSCNASVQKVLDVQTAKGRATWPLKCAL